MTGCHNIPFNSERKNTFRLTSALGLRLFYREDIMSGSKKESFRSLLIGALIGSLLTGVSQYLINIQLYEQKLKIQKDTAVTEYLKQKLLIRTQAYKIVAQKVNEAILSPTPENSQAAIRSLHVDIPFFQPKVESQSRIQSTKSTLINMLENFDGKSLKTHGSRLYERLKQNFQDDLDSISKELLFENRK